MGGKKKHTAQRTKKGVMPANSGRAAELMTASLSAIKGFGECSLATNLTQISTLPLDILDPTIDPNFQVVLKKMSKKDSITRHKALTEFMNLCYESNDEAIKSALPSWIRLYGNLSLDIEHRIREAAHLAHHAIVTKVGRNLAPYIKQIAPYWFISQYDTYPPAASAASNSFKAAFPPHKLVDVIVFCQMEILEFISDNILNHSPETVGKSEKANKENLEAKYEQILISSLNGYSLYFSKVSKEHLEKVAHINTNIIASPKFWKLNKYKNGAVRAAWFSLLSAMLQFAPNLIENEQKRVTNAVLGNINDYDPVVLPKVWEAALLIVSGIKDCWQYVSMDKFFMPKFTNILAQGGQGNASFIYPNIILLLSNIPEAVMKDKITFFGKIFSSFQKGLKQPCITSSHCESEAAAQSFIECIQYLIMIYTDDTEFCLTLINRYVIDVLSNTMMDKIHQHLNAPLCCSLLQMLLHWKNNETTNDNYKKYTEEFWNKFVIVIKDNVNKCLLDKEALTYLFESIIKIMDYLNNRKFKRKKDLKVKFSHCEMESEPKNEVQTTEIINESLVDDVIKAAKELTHEYFNIATNSENYEIRVLSIQQLWKITIIFKTDQLMTLMEGYEKDFCTGLRDWIKDENISTEPLIGVIFATVDNIQNESLKNDILSDFIKVRSKDAILESAKLANSYVNDTLNKWMKSTLVKEELCNLFKTLNEENISIDVILQCLKSDPTNGFIIGEETVLALLSVLAGHLTCESASHNERLSTIIDSFFTNNPACLRNYKGILFELLHLCFQAIINDQNMGSLFIAWRKGLALLSTILNPDDLALLDHARVCSNFIAEHININNTKNDINLSIIIKLSVHFISAVVQGNPDKMSNIGVEISSLFLNSVIDRTIFIYQQKIEELCFNTEVINGNLYFVENEKEKNNSMIVLKEKWDPLKDINIISYIRSLMFCVKYVLYLIDDSQVDNDDVDNEDKLNLEWSIPSFNFGELNDFVPLCLKLCYGLTLSNKFKLYFNDTKQYFMVGDLVESFGSLLKELVHRLQPDQQTEIYSLATHNAENLCKLWSQTCSIISNDFLDMDRESKKKCLNDDILTDSLTIEYVRALRNDLINGFIHESYICEIMDNLVKCYKAQNITTHCKDLSNCDYSTLKAESEIVRLLSELTANFPSEINKSKNGWDFIMICLASWIKSISLTKTSSCYKEYVGFVIAVCDLYKNFIHNLITEQKDTKLYEEWRDVFQNDTCTYIGNAWDLMAQKTLNSNLNYVGLIHLKQLSETVCLNCRTAEISNLLATTSNYEMWLSMGKKFITSPCIAVQITAHNILLMLVPVLVKMDGSCDENELHKLTCGFIKTQFIETQSFVTTMLQDFSLGVSCSVTPFTDSYTYTLAYMLLWSVLLEMCKRGDSQVRYIYTLWIKEMDLIVHVMENLLKLMPDSVLHFIESNVKRRLETFSEMPSLSFDGWESGKLSNYCCWLFCDILRTLPAVARQWSAETDPKLLSFADKITTSYVSSALCAEEMKSIMNQQKGFDNMKITTHPSVREVVAVYTVEESSTELIITLANNHPLTPPKVEIPKAMISSNQTRQWLMQLTIFLTHQNGSIWDGLLLWKSNLDKKFEGIEECYICFSILHNTSHQLPKLSCQTCKKKFHSFCLYKWFTTSNKSTCPICRNHF